MAPVVTGVSPKEGPPGTKVTIRGERLGSGQQDVLCVALGDWDATLSMEWQSPNKLIVLSGPARGPCDVIVTTRGGGRGSCTVQYRGVDQIVGHLKASAIWLQNFETEREEILQELVSTHGLGQEDVLGISMEGYDARFPEDRLEEMFPAKSGSLFSESFDPSWFLLENHHQSGYDDLRAGLSFLRRKVHSEKEGQLSFLKDHAGLVVDQLDALSEMRRLFREHAGDQDPMVAMETALNSSKAEADKLFEEVLRRKERADCTRNALAVLQRYKFLFFLPVQMKNNLRRREYDQIISDYSKARGLFGESEVEVFQRVMRVVENKVVELRDVLRARLLEVTGSFEDQRMIVRYLVSLETPGDVGWESISSEHAYIESVLRGCREQYASPTSPAIKLMTTDSQTSAPPVVLFIEDVADRMATKFPGLLKLSNSYFRGDLHCTPDTARRADLRRLVRSTVELWSGLVRGALLPHTADSPELVWAEAPREPAWLHVCLREVTAVCSSLQGVGMDTESLDELSQLVFDLRKHSLMAMFSSAMENVRKLPERDAWIMEPTLEAGYGYTQLLTLFNKLVSDLNVHVEESILLTAVTNETPLMDDETVRRDVVVLIYNLVATFAQLLERLGFEETVSDDDGESSDGQLDAGKSGPLSIERRLLLVLSNCHVLRVSRVPRLTQMFTEHGFPSAEVNSGMVKVADVLSDLEQKLFEAYMEEKADPILGIMEMSMYEGEFDWAEVSSPPVGVRDYIKETLISCILVHAEVYAVSPLLVPRVLCNLTEGVAEELGRLVGAVTRMSPAGGQQARLDLAVIQEALQLYTTEAARTSFVEAAESLPNHQDPAGDKKLSEQLMKRFRSSMSLHLACFSKQPAVDDFKDD